MANYLTTDTDLTAVANAIRTKGGTSAQLAFPSGFVDAIQAISGGGGPDFSSLHQDCSKNNFGGLFTAFDAGTWGYIEKSFTSGTNPLTVDFGREIKGCIAYPKSLAAPSDLVGESLVFGIGFWGAADTDGVQARIWQRSTAKSGNTTTWWPRTSGNDTIVNGVYTRTPTYPSNQNYHPFGFNKPYIFVYWW